MLNYFSIKTDCENFVQHYSFSLKQRKVNQIAYWHCLKTTRKSCEGCPYFVPRKEKVEDEWFSVGWKLDMIIKEVKNIEKTLKEHEIID